MKTNKEILEWVKNHSTDFQNAGLYADFERFLEEGISGNNQVIPSDEPDYIEIPFDLETAQEHPEWLYTKNGDKVEELVKFNTARYDYQYACTIDGVLETFRSGNDFVLRIPKPKKVKKWIATYVVEGERVAGELLLFNLATAKSFYGPTYTDVQYHEIEVEK